MCVGGFINSKIHQNALKWFLGTVCIAYFFPLINGMFEVLEEFCVT